MKVLLLILVLVVLLSGCRGVEGASGIGDPLAPNLGNGGYDVLHYTIVVDYDPATNDLSGSTSIEAYATQSLRTFNLDFQGLGVDSVEVNGSPASYSRKDHELTVIPSTLLASEGLFSVHVMYHGSPIPRRSQLSPLSVGWFHAQDGSVNVMNYPDGAANWFPCNDHMSDKATFRFEVTVPSDWFVLGPGTLLETKLVSGHSRYVYKMNSPMATTSAVLHIDNYEVEALDPVDGVPLAIYFPTGSSEELKQKFVNLPEMLNLLSDAFGPFPFDRYSIVIADPGIAICANYGGVSNSEQTVTLQCPTSYMTEDRVTVHELAHQWFGTSVTQTLTTDTWLSEGPATYAEWLWLTREGGFKAIDQLARLHEKDYHPKYSIGKPPAGNIMSDEVYTGGALLLHALRLRIGEEAFFDTLSTFQARYKYSHAATSDFIAIAEEISGEDLQSFFDAWLLQAVPPSLPDIAD